MKSAAVASLTSELRIASRLRRLGWSTSHGSFFVDPVTDKPREIDVLAKRFWRRRRDTHEQIAHLDLVIEVKAIRDYHLVFAPSSFSPSYARTERTWIGYASERSVAQTHLVEALKRAGIGMNEISTILERLFGLAYPDETEQTMVVGDFVLDPPPAPFVASAFRETNIGGQKDLSASVLWKAAQTLNAFVDSSSAAHMQSDFEVVEFVSDYARLQELDLVETILDELAREVQRVHLYHPIVVVSASLWALNDGDLSELPWCRFHRLDKDGLMSDWYDVVQSDALDDYLRLVTKHYDRGMEKANAKR